ncbi:hypothetical protein TNCV_2374911 [Trichonephila clavipes]|nr:hypothetical protein TNCV_2374911 [Trichonephila clavipes]
MVLKANDRRTSCPCHDEFRGPRSDYVRQHSRTSAFNATIVGSNSGTRFLEGPSGGSPHFPELLQLSSPRLIEDETFNDSDIKNNLIDYEDGLEEPDSLRGDKNMHGSSFPKNWKSIFLK